MSAESRIEDFILAPSDPAWGDERNREEYYRAMSVGYYWAAPAALVGSLIAAAEGARITSMAVLLLLLATQLATYRYCSRHDVPLASITRAFLTPKRKAVMAAILREEYAAGPFKMLMHCYTSGAELAKIAAEMGAWFSVSGIATFKAAEDVRAVIRDMPGDRIIVETDCPYLAPIPHRGRRNEPAYVGLVLDKLAEIRGWSAEEAERITTEAFFGLFDRIPKPA